MTDIVDAEKHDDKLYSRLTQDVTVKSGQSWRREKVSELGLGGMQNPIADDALVENTKVTRWVATLQPLGQMVWPAMVRIDRRVDSVSDGITEGNDGSCGHFLGDVNAGQKVPERCGRRAGQICVAGEVAGSRCDVTGLKSHQVRGRGNRNARQIDAHRQVGKRRQWQAHRIAENQGSSRDRERRLPTEGYGAIGASGDFCSRRASRNVSGSDDQRAGTEGVRDFDADAIAAYAGVNDQAQGLIGILFGRAGGTRRAGGPSADPVFFNVSIAMMIALR